MCLLLLVLEGFGFNGLFHQFFVIATYALSVSFGDLLFHRVEDVLTESFGGFVIAWFGDLDLILTSVAHSLARAAAVAFLPGLLSLFTLLSLETLA